MMEFRFKVKTTTMANNVKMNDESTSRFNMIVFKY